MPPQIVLKPETALSGRTVKGCVRAEDRGRVMTLRPYIGWSLTSCFLIGWSLTSCFLIGWSWIIALTSLKPEFGGLIKLSPRDLTVWFDLRE